MSSSQQSEPLIVHMPPSSAATSHVQRRSSNTKSDDLYDNAPLSEPRWFTLEFYLYYAMFIWVYGNMFIELYRMSSPDHVVYPTIRARLSHGWLFGRELDNSDAQYAGFRNRIPLLVAVMGGYLFVSWLIRGFRPHQTPAWKYFILLFALVFLAVLHGTGLIKILLILSGNFVLMRSVSHDSALAPILMWIYGLSILFLNDLYKGYSFGTLSPSLSFLDDSTGLMPRWYINFNITLLRMLSFGMDYHWSFRKRAHGDRHKHHCEECSKGLKCDRLRNETSLSIKDYSYINYLTYCLYTPLYLAGPIVTFNNFISQINEPKSFHLRTVMLYGLRLLGALLLMETMMHLMHVVSMSKEREAWSLLSPYQLALFSYWNLKFIWLKLLIIWRFFRFWSIADGMDVMENMARCMSNNYSPIGFWRGWHCSYNRWLIRYIYVPMGGSKHRALNTLLVFTFVAVWHDLHLRLLLWGWLITLFILPEIVLKKVSRPIAHAPWFRHVAALGGAFNIITMISANLVGFSIGIEGFKDIARKILDPTEPFFLLGIVVCTFIATQVMFELHEEERRQKARQGFGKSTGSE